MSKFDVFRNLLFLPSNDKHAYFFQEVSVVHTIARTLVIRHVEFDYLKSTIKFSEPAWLSIYNDIEYSYFYRSSSHFDDKLIVIFDKITGPNMERKTDTWCYILKYTSKGKWDTLKEIELTPHSKTF